MIEVDSLVRIIAPDVEYGRIARVDRIDATSSDGRVWYRLGMKTLTDLPRVCWLCAQAIEEVQEHDH